MKLTKHINVQVAQLLPQLLPQTGNVVGQYLLQHGPANAPAPKSRNVKSHQSKQRNMKHNEGVWRTRGVKEQGHEVHKKRHRGGERDAHTYPVRERGCLSTEGCRAPSATSNKKKNTYSCRLQKRKKIGKPQPPYRNQRTKHRKPAPPRPEQHTHTARGRPTAAVHTVPVHRYNTSTRRCVHRS